MALFKTVFYFYYNIFHKGQHTSDPTVIWSVKVFSCQS